MDPARIAELLHPFLGTPNRSPRVPHPSPFGAPRWEPVTTGPKACHSDPEKSEGEESTSLAHSPNSCHSDRREESAFLSPSQLQSISTYIDLLLRWNSRINLTGIRDPEEIVPRHFGESLFAGIAAGAPSSSRSVRQGGDVPDLIDLGSGAGFPGLPIKIWAPHLRVTLIESNQKKATFLREVIRALTLTDINVFSARAEDFPKQATVVTLRAVERFESALPAAARLLAPGGRLVLLIGYAQADRARQLLPSLQWSTPVSVPLSTSRIVLTGTLD